MKTITTNDLKAMKKSEGLILQGCGGDLEEWVDGINDMLTEEYKCQVNFVGFRSLKNALF